MKNPPTATRAEGAIWERLLEPWDKPLPLVAARAIARLEFATADAERMSALAAKARDGSLNPAERAEIDLYERVGNVLALMKSKARQRLRRAGTNGARR